MPPKPFIVNGKSPVAILFFFLLIYSLLAMHYSLAQSPTPPSALEKAQNDYNFQYSKYRDAQEKYITARSSYFLFKTATAKNDAFVATKNHLDQVVKLYVTFGYLTREYINSFNWGNFNDQKIKSISILDNQTATLTSFQQQIAATITLEQLPPIAADLKTYLEGEFASKHNKVLSSLEIGEAESTLDDFNSLAGVLDQVVVFKLRSGGTKSILANWTSEIKNIRVNTQKAITEAKNLNSQTRQDQAKEGELDAIIRTTEKAKSELKRSKPLFEEVIRII
ncbi:MAG: hypothetical protein AAB639_02315 [Patescibacteria group bacterium]